MTRKKKKEPKKKTNDIHSAVANTTPGDDVDEDLDVFQSTHERDDSENIQDVLKPLPKSSKKSDDKEEKEGAKKKN